MMGAENTNAICKALLGITSDSCAAIYVVIVEAHLHARRRGEDLVVQPGYRIPAAQDAPERVVELGEGVGAPHSAQRGAVALVEGVVERLQRGVGALDGRIERFGKPVAGVGPVAKVGVLDHLRIPSECSVMVRARSRLGGEDWPSGLVGRGPGG